MQRLIRNHPNRLGVIIAASLASFIVLITLFVATMLLQYRFIDFSYLSFALLRILAISTMVAAAAFALAKHLKSLAIAALFGSVAGFIGAVTVVNAAA